jgi:hypothetical protein
MKFIRVISLLSALALSSGCAEVRTNVSTYYSPNHSARGSLIGLPLDDTQSNSLEFRNIQTLVYSKLFAAGFSSARPNVTADYAFFLTYGIDSGRTVTSSVPIVGQTGGGTSYSSGTIMGSGGAPPASYSGITTTMPTYGIVGMVPVSNTTYKRQLNIDVYKVSSSPEKIYEIRATSTGTCGNMQAVLPLMIDAVFKNFPPKISGSQFNVDLPADSLRNKC